MAGSSGAEPFMRAVDQTVFPARPVRRIPTPRWKRAVDVGVCGSALLTLSPLIAVIAGLVAHKLGRPVLFRQARGGHGGEVFEIVKFRTMTEARDDTGALLPDAERRHPLGQFLRSTSLDELPTLVNVVRGEMSLVGPRPLMAAYLTRFDEAEAQRHRVVPGLTGLAQVRGRNTLDWADKFALDLEYIEHRSPTLDLRILIETITSVLRRTGADGADLTTEFQGRHAPASADPIATKGATP